MSDSPYIVDVTRENFDTVVVEGSHALPVLVDFWAAWCNPCRMLTPVLERLVEEFRGKFLLAKVDTEQQQELAARFAVRSLPTVRLFKNGQPVDEFMGALPEADVRAFLQPHLPRASDKLLAEAQTLIEAGQLDAAVRLVEQARTADPENPRVQIAYARLKATLGELAEAESALSQLPLQEQEDPEVIRLRARLLFDKVASAAPPPEALERSLASDPANSEVRYQLAAHRVMQADYEAALGLLLELIRKDRSYGNDAARKGMLAIFDMLGESDDLVTRYRARLFNALH